MKKSRKLFVLSGPERDVNIVIEELSCRYKALISANFCTENDICAIFNINKSIVCAQENFSILPNKFLKDAISKTPFKNPPNVGITKKLSFI